MKENLESMDSGIYPPLLSFWQIHARPGYVGLVGIQFFLARIVEKGQARLTADEIPSQWAHAFFFQQPRDGIPWIYENDMGVMQHGFFKWEPRAQENPVIKWSGQRILRACVLNAGLTDQQTQAAFECARELISRGMKYRLRELLGTWIAIRRSQMEKDSFLHTKNASHCGAFVRDCLMAAGVDPFGRDVAVSNTAPELIYQKLNLVAFWERETGERRRMD